MSKHTVAVMGLGVRGKIHIHGLLGNPDDFEITGICDIKQEALDLVAEEYHLQHVPQFLDVEEMLKTVRPEVFVFVTYPDMRLNMIELAIRYGVKAVSFEKPMAESLPEAKKMVDRRGSPSSALTTSTMHCGLAGDAARNGCADMRTAQMHCQIPTRHRIIYWVHWS